MIIKNYHKTNIKEENLSGGKQKKRNKDYSE